MPGTNGKLRSACDTCHRLKVRCSGDSPCEGCVSLGNSCSYSLSGQRGRPKGVKNRRVAEHDARPSLQNRNPASGSEKRSSNFSSKQQSPAPPMDDFNRQPQPSQQQQTSHQSPDSIIDDESLSFTAMINSLMVDSAIDMSFDFDDPQERPSYDTRSYEFSDSHGISEGAQNFQVPAFKSPLETYDISLDDIVPKSFPVSHYSSPLSNASGPDSISNNSDPRRLTEFLERSSLPRSTTHGAASSMKCSCCRRNADLLCSLKVSEFNETPFAYKLDAVLLCVQEAIKTWRGLIECTNCACKNDDDVLLLALMSVRIVLVRIQLAFGPWTAQTRNRKTLSPHQSSVQQQLQPAEVGWPGCNTRISVGTYDITGNDRVFMLRVLLLKALRKIKSAMVCFGEMLDRKKTGLDSMPELMMQSPMSPINRTEDQRCVASNLKHVEQMLLSLARFLQTLERQLEREWNDDCYGPGFY